MKFIINRAYDIFRLSDEFLKQYPYFDYSPKGRTNLEFIAAVEEYGIDKINKELEMNGSHVRLSILEIPQEATDWCLDQEYNGMETFICVVDGRLKFMG